MKNDHERLIDLNPIVHEPVRLGILMLLHLNISLAFSVVQKGLGVTSGNLNSHVRKLTDEGYVRIEKAFVDLRPRTLIHITETGRQSLRQYAGSLKKILSTINND